MADYIWSLALKAGVSGLAGAKDVYCFDVKPPTCGFGSLTKKNHMERRDLCLSLLVTADKRRR